MSTHHNDGHVQIHHGDCLDVLRQLPDNSVDSVVTDPPAGISFMGRDWDTDHGGRDRFVAWLTERLIECHRLMKPGAYAFVWAMPRTSGWTQRAIEDAGLIPRDCVVHLFGSGFPKSHNLPGGFGTALKPASEHWWLARKPLGAATVAGNVLRWGTGTLNVDACRIGTGADKDDERWYKWERGGSVLEESKGMHTPGRVAPQPPATQGRWPANVILDESQAAELDQMSGDRPGSRTASPGNESGKVASGVPFVPGKITSTYDDQGGASRFFLTVASDPLPIDTLQERFLYTAKAPKKERPTYDTEGGQVAHPTVKPLALMRWLVKLVTPPGGTCLDPFAGSGATIEACMLEGFNVIGVEREAEYLPLIMQRVNRQYEARALVDLLPRPAPSLFDEDEGAA